MIKYIQLSQNQYNALLDATDHWKKVAEWLAEQAGTRGGCPPGDDNCLSGINECGKCWLQAAEKEVGG